jgi:hypothetical protein
LSDRSREIIGEFSSYAGLHAILRARALEMGISRETLDTISGMPAGYSAKLLAPRPMRTLGAMSMPALLPVLGLKLVVMEDEEKVQQYAERIKAAAVGRHSVHGRKPRRADPAS